MGADYRREIGSYRRLRCRLREPGPVREGGFMRKFVFFAVLVLLPAFAFGQSAITLNPSSVRQFTAEWDLVITGSNLAGNVATKVLFTNGTTTDEIDALS